MDQLESVSVGVRTFVVSVAIIQRENLQRLDEDIAVLKQYLKTEGAPKATMQTLETLSNEVHASWQVAVEHTDSRVGTSTAFPM